MLFYMFDQELCTSLDECKKWENGLVRDYNRFAHKLLTPKEKAEENEILDFLQ